MTVKSTTPAHADDGTVMSPVTRIGNHSKVNEDIVETAKQIVKATAAASLAMQRTAAGLFSANKYSILSNCFGIEDALHKGSDM